MSFGGPPLLGPLAATNLKARELGDFSETTFRLRKFLEMSPVTFFVLSFNGLPIKELKQFLGQYLPCDYLCKKDNGDRKNSGTLRGAGIFQGSSLESSRVLDLF